MQENKLNRFPIKALELIFYFNCLGLYYLLIAGGVNLCFAFGAPFSSVVVLQSFGKPFVEDDNGPTIFGIIEDTGLKPGWDSFGTSRLELFDNGRGGCRICNPDAGGDGLGPSWLGGIGLDWSEIPFADFDGDKGEAGVETIGKIEGINL